VPPRGIAPTSPPLLGPCTEYWIDFTVALKVIDVIDKNQMYDNAIAGKENAPKGWNYITSMFLTSGNVYFRFGFYVLCVNALKLLSGFFWLFWDKVWRFW